MEKQRHKRVRQRRGNETQRKRETLKRETERERQ